MSPEAEQIEIQIQFDLEDIHVCGDDDFGRAADWRFYAVLLEDGEDVAHDRRAIPKAGIA